MKKVILAGILVLGLAYAALVVHNPTQAQAARVKPTPTPTPVCQWLPLGCNPSSDPTCEYSCTMP